MSLYTWQSDSNRYTMKGATMNDYIKREDAIKAFGLSEKSRKYGGDHSGYSTLMLYEIQDIIEDISSADVVERKRGEWAKRTHDTLIAQVNFAYCSECGQPIMHEHTRPLWNFCPNCGADMRTEQTERSE